MVERLFLAVPRGCLQLVIVVFPDHTHLLFFMVFNGSYNDILFDLWCYPIKCKMNKSILIE